MQMAENSRALTLLQKEDSIIAVARDIRISKKGNLSIKKVGCVITTRNDIEEEVGLWLT